MSGSAEFAERLSIALLGEEQFLVVNLSHASATNYYVSFWRPDNSGYAYPLCWAGLYPRSKILASLDYYHSGENIVVRAVDVLPLLVSPVRGSVDGDAGPVVANTQQVWRELFASMIGVPGRQPKPSPLRDARTIELVTGVHDSQPEPYRAAQRG